MASNREERFLQRQRGAGIHKIKDIDFGLAFPGANNAPLRPQRSSRRRTPQPEQQPLLPQRSSRRTPKPAEQLLPQRSTRRTPTTARNHLAERPSPYDIPRTEDKEGLPSSRATQSDSQGSVSKKRRITGPASARRLSTIAQTALLEAPSASSSELQSPNTLPKGPRTTARGENEVAEEAEAPAADHVPDQGRRNRPLAIAKGLGKRKTKGESPTLKATPVVPAQEPVETVTRSENQPEEQEPGSTSDKQQRKKPRRKKRTSIGKIPKKRKQSMITTGEIEIPHNKLAEEALQAQEQALAVPRRNQTRQRKALATVEEEDDEEDEEQQAEEEDEESNKYLKAAPRFVKHHSQQSKPVRRRTTTSNKQGSRRRGGTADSNVAVAEGSEVTSARKPNRNSISITVHRLSRLQALQTVDDDEDTRNGPPSFPKRNGVNAIDVLAQVCREIIAKAVEKLHEGAETQQNEAGKGEWKRKGKAAIAFGAELDSRLFDMSEALDNNWALSTRVKQANKEKIALREELLRVRREREKVALRTDEVRRLHEEATKASQDQNVLNTALYDVELAVERSRTQQRAQKDSSGADNSKSVGLELLLQSVAANAASSNGNGGLLSQVKEFNAYLERAATLLEGRA